MATQPTYESYTAFARPVGTSGPLLPTYITASSLPNAMLAFNALYETGSNVTRSTMIGSQQTPIEISHPHLF